MATKAPNRRPSISEPDDESQPAIPLAWLRVLPRGQGLISVTGEVPLAEITDDASRLKSMTGGQGAYSIKFARHAQVPPQVQQKLAASFKLKDEGE